MAKMPRNHICAECNPTCLCRDPVTRSGLGQDRSPSFAMNRKFGSANYLFREFHGVVCGRTERSPSN